MKGPPELGVRGLPVQLSAKRHNQVQGLAREGIQHSLPFRPGRPQRLRALKTAFLLSDIHI